MSDRSIASPPHGRAARLLVCGFGPFPGVAENPAALVVESLRRRRWAPQGADAAYAILPTTWNGAVGTAAEALRETGAGGVLLLGVASRAETFRVEMRAQNRARTDLPDAEGAFCPRPRILASGPAVARATAPVEPMVRALRGEGLEACASSDAGDYLCNYIFYRLLVEVAAWPSSPRTAFLHLPPAREDLGLEDLERGVRAVASAFARTLALGPRADAVTV